MSSCPLPFLTPSASITKTSTSTQSVSSSSPQVSSASPPSPETARQIREARTALDASLVNLGNSLSSSLQSRAATLHTNSAALQKQQDELLKNVTGLRKAGDMLEKELHRGTEKVKELGNVQNWAEMLERDMLVLQETMRLADESESESESDWSEDNEDADPEGDVKMGEAEVATAGDMDDGGLKKRLDKGKGVDRFMEGNEMPAGGSSTAGTTEESGTECETSSVHTTQTKASEAS